MYPLFSISIHRNQNGSVKNTFYLNISDENTFLKCMFKKCLYMNYTTHSDLTYLF